MQFYRWCSSVFSDLDRTGFERKSRDLIEQLKLLEQVPTNHDPTKVTIDLTLATESASADAAKIVATALELGPEWVQAGPGKQQGSQFVLPVSIEDPEHKSKDGKVFVTAVGAMQAQMRDRGSVLRTSLVGLVPSIPLIACLESAACKAPVAGRAHLKLQGEQACLCEGVHA